MSSSERRYDIQSLGAPIFGIQLAYWIALNAPVPIIPNIGPLCSPTVNKSHTAFQKTSRPSGDISADIY